MLAKCHDQILRAASRVFLAVQALPKSRHIVPSYLVMLSVGWLCGAIAAETTTVDPMLTQPLSMENAVRMSIENNPTIAAAYARVGLNAMDVIDAGLTQSSDNPRSWFSQPQPMETLDTETIMASLQALKTSGSQQSDNSPNRRIVAMQQRSADEIFELIINTENAFVRYSAASEQLRIWRWIGNSDQLAAELAKKFHEAGNLPLSSLTEHQTFAMQSAQALADAQLAEINARTELAELMGLATDQPWTIRAGLLLPKQALPELSGLISNGLNASPELRLSRQRLTQLTQRNEAGAGQDKLQALLSSVDPFKAGSAQTSDRWQANMQQAISQIEVKNINTLTAALTDYRREMIKIRNRIDQAHTNLEITGSYLIRFSQDALPLWATRVDEEQKRVNFMLSGAFDLLSIKRQQYEAWLNYVNQVSQWWQYRADLSLSSRIRFGQPDSHLLLQLSEYEVLVSPADTADPQSMNNRAAPHSHEHADHRSQPHSQGHQQ